MTPAAPLPPDPERHNFEAVYGALRAQARQYLRREQNANSMSPTLLVHEAWIALARSPRVPAAGGSHYMKLVSRVMKNLLIDHARRKRALAHGGALRQVDWSDVNSASHDDRDLILAVAAAMKGLETLSPRLAALVELRYFNGFTEREAAQILGISVRSVRRQWKVARLRLLESLNLSEEDQAGE